MVLGYVTESMARSRWVPTTFWKNPALLAIHHRSIGAIHLLKSVPPTFQRNHLLVGFLGYLTESMARSRWVTTTFWKNPALLAIHRVDHSWNVGLFAAWSVGEFKSAGGNKRLPRHSRIASGGHGRTTLWGGCLSNWCLAPIRKNPLLWGNFQRFLLSLSLGRCRHKRSLLLPLCPARRLYQKDHRAVLDWERSSVGLSLDRCQQARSLWGIDKSR